MRGWFDAVDLGLPDLNVDITPTQNGLRLSQHGVVLSELRTSPGPTHSVFDVLAALIAIFKPAGRVGVLGFAGGSLVAPMRALESSAKIEAVDLHRDGYDLFCEHCGDWCGEVNWRQADAVTWLQTQRKPFDILMDDLSVPVAGDVIKPAVSWDIVPELIRTKLEPDGVAILNLLKPEQGSWRTELRRLGAMYRQATVVHLDDFENRILVCGDKLPGARETGRLLRRALRRLRSRQAGRLQLRRLNQL